MSRAHYEDRGHDTQCLIFDGARDSDGYGSIMTGSRTDGTRRARSVHTVVWEAVFGPVLNGQELDHLCNVRECLNIQHLESKTHQANCARADHSHNALPRPWQVGHPRYRFAGVAARAAMGSDL